MADNKSCEGKVIGGKRICGKSTELIKQSHKTGVRILTANKQMARILMDESKKMGLDIKPPLTPDVKFDYFGDVKEVLIDEVEMVLQQLIGKRVTSMSTSYQLEELPSLRNVPEPPVTGPNIKQKKFNVGDVKVKLDLSDNIKQLKAIQREAKKATASLRELEEQKKDKYLVIEVDELGNVPKVVYKGKEITAKEFVNFQWTTKSEVPGNTDVIVDYFEKDTQGYASSKSIREGISS